MYTLNQLTIIGFTGNDGEAHYTPNGTLVVTLSVATKESWKDADNSWQSRTDWHRVVTFGKLAEYTRTLTKGSYVMVQGAVRTREYERDGIASATAILACRNPKSNGSHEARTPTVLPHTLVRSFVPRTGPEIGAMICEGRRSPNELLRVARFTPAIASTRGR